MILFEDSCPNVSVHVATGCVRRGGYGAHFYNSIDNFQLPSRSVFDLHRRLHRALILLFDLYFFFPRGGVIFRNFPASCTIIAIVASCRNRGRPRWNVARKVDDKLPIDCSSPSVSFYLYVILKFPAKIVMENTKWTVYFVKLFVCISIDWKIWKRMII